MDPTQQPKRSATERARAIALWARDTGLGSFGFALVLAVALSGWSASFIGLHDFGVHHMSLSQGAAWLVPATFDGAPAGLSIVVMRASIHGRSALLWRLLIVGFTLLSSWINYEHINDPVGRIVASFMPPSAVILFEGLMSEVRAAAHRRDGRTVRPRLHPLRFVFDWPGTIDIIRAYVLGLPLPGALAIQAQPRHVICSGPTGAIIVRRPVPKAGLATLVATSGAGTVAIKAAEAADNLAAIDAPSVDSSAPTVVDSGSASKRQNDTAPVAPTVASRPAPLSTAPRQRAPRPVARKGGKSPRRSMDEWVEVAGPIFQSELHRLRRQPTASEFAAAISKAKLGTVSDSTAKNIRTEILDRTDVPALSDEGL